MIEHNWRDDISPEALEAALAPSPSVLREEKDGGLKFVEMARRVDADGTPYFFAGGLANCYVAQIAGTNAPFITQIDELKTENTALRAEVERLNTAGRIIKRMVDDADSLAVSYGVDRMHELPGSLLAEGRSYLASRAPVSGDERKTLIDRHLMEIGTLRNSFVTSETLLKTERAIAEHTEAIRRLMEPEEIVALRAEVERLNAKLQDEIEGRSAEYDRLEKYADGLIAEVERLKKALEEWEECAQYDACMEGPVFKSWNRSALDRCRRKAEIERAVMDKKDAQG